MTDYVTQSVFSDPSAQVDRYADLPADPAALARIVRGLLVHRFEGERLGYTIAQDRLHNDAETRYVDDILALIAARNDASLSEPRRYDDRFVGICRDFSLLHCSMLRHAGIPARIRSGFVDYFGSDGFQVDHVVTEYWDDAHGWRLADAQLAGGVYEVDFDPMDVPRDRFVVAGAAWQAIRTGGAGPKNYGLPPDLVGAWFVAGNVLLDLAALNKVEPLLWDVWGAGTTDEAGLTPEVCELYDRVAEVTAVVDTAAARELFRTHDGLRMPRTVRSMAPYNGTHEVTLRPYPG